MASPIIEVGVLVVIAGIMLFPLAGDRYYDVWHWIRAKTKKSKKEDEEVA